MKSLIQCLFAFLFFAYAHTVLGECADPEVVCGERAPLVVPGATCFVTALCYDEDCMLGARGDYILVSASDDPEDEIYDGYTIRWLARHPGVMQTVDALGPLNCGLIDHPHGSFIILPEALHCATKLSVGPDDVYVEFFASIPGVCHAWGECRCE